MKTKEETMVILLTPEFSFKDTVELFGANEIYKGFFVYCEFYNDCDGLNKIRKVGIVSIKHPNDVTEITRSDMTIATTRLVLIEKRRKVLTNEK